MQMKENGSNTAQHLPQRIWHPHCGWSVCWLWSRPGVVAGSFLQWIPYYLGGHLPVQFPQKGTVFTCSRATLMQSKAQGSDGDNCCKAPSWSERECSGRHTQKMQGQFLYGTENFLAKVVFVVSALLNCLWQVSFMFSWNGPHGCCLSQWHCGNRGLFCCSRGHPCAQMHCQVKSFGKGWGVHSLHCKMAAEG